MPTAIAVEESEKLDTGLTIAVFVDPVESARAAGLRYVTDDEPGIRRRKRGKGFTYLDPQKADGQGREDPGAHPQAGHPAGLDGRLDLPPAQRPPAGHRPRRPRAQAVPLSRRLAGGARRDQVRPHDRLRRGAAGHPRADRAGHVPARPGAGEGARHRDQAAGDHPDPHRQQGVRPAEQLLRPHHPARPARGRRGVDPALRVPRQERQGALGGGAATGGWRASSSSAATCRGRSSSSTWTRPGSGRASAPRTSTPTCGRRRARTSRPRTSAPGAGRCSPSRPCWRSAPARTSGRPARPWSRRSSTSPDSSATVRPSAASTTSTRW